MLSLSMSRKGILTHSLNVIYNLSLTLCLSLKQFMKKNQELKMKKTIILCLVILFNMGLHCNQLNLSWNKPAVDSQTYTSFLENNYDEEKIYQNIFISSESNFALASFQDFTLAFKFFLSQKDDNNIWNYHSESFHLAANLFTGYEYNKPGNTDYYSFTYSGMKLRGHLHKNLVFYSNFWKGHYSNNIEYAKANSVNHDSWTQDSDDDTKTYIDNMTGKIQFNSAYGNYAIGRGKYEIGSNIGGSIILSNSCNDYGYASASIPFGNFQVKIIHASILPDTTKIVHLNKPENFVSDKYLVTHTLDWNPSQNLHMFMGEHVVYGNRSIDPSYLLPVSIFRITEHNQSDRDNVLIFMGADWQISNFTTYFNFIFDELSQSKITTDWWGNKYAFQTGSSYKFKNHRIGAEFTAIRPWIYTHKYPQNIFSNDNRALGFSEGGNLLQYAAELNLQIRKNLHWNTNAAFIRQGSVGNDFSEDYDNRPSDHAAWLEGTISNRVKIKSTISWNPLSHHKLLFGINYSNHEDEDSQKEIYLGYQAEY